MRLELLAHIITLSTYCYMYQVELPVALPQLISDIGVNSHQVSTISMRIGKVNF